jgi:hypothetical protein
MDAQASSAGCGAIATNVPVMWIDHFPIKVELPGVREGLCGTRVYELKEVSWTF